MKTISKLLVGFGVLMGSMGFTANAKVPPQGPPPGPKGPQIQNVGKPQPGPQPGYNYNKGGKAPMQPNGRRNNGPQKPPQPPVCQECLHHAHIKGYHCTNPQHALLHFLQIIL